MAPLTLGTQAKYRITIQGYLDSSWSDDFGGMVVNNEISKDGSSLTILAGSLVDQAALFGVLDGLYGLGFPLISVDCVDFNQAE